MSTADDITCLNTALEGRYRIERQLGEGGMATVYLARDEKHRRSVALKVLQPQFTAALGADRFLAEIETTANLHHPHVLPLFDSGEANGCLFYTMPFVEGESLRDRLDREHQLSLEEAVSIAVKVSEALEHAHRRGVIHRDVKPGNILLQDGEPLVMDFGVSLALSAVGDARITRTGLSLGTPAYMSPEQATGDHEVDARSDVYAIACVLYEMLTGERPYPGATPAGILARKLMNQPTSVRVLRQTVPVGIEAAVVKALSVTPVDRQASARDFAGALKDGLSKGHEAAAAEPDEAEVREELASVLSSSYLAKSWRLSTLLEFIVEETLAGRGDRLKEARIGLEVFDRSGRTYDPAIDPIVRVQMGRLRTKLRSYYESEGAQDPVEIDVPVGSYRPTFRRRTQGAHAVRSTREDVTDEGDDHRIAVLPFANMSDDPANQYFCDGLTDELINRLARTPELRVVARTSTFQFKEMARDVREVGRQLDAARILEGSVRRYGDRVRVTVQLINVADGCHVWSERYDGELTDIFEIHERISEAIQGALVANVLTPKPRPVPSPRSESFEAYNHYLLGRHHWKKRTEEGLRAALDHFTAAVEIDPSFARGYSGLADCYLMLGMSATEAPDACMPRAGEAAARALELDGGLAEAHTSLAAVKNCYEWDLEGAQEGYDRARALDPGYATTLHWAGVFACSASGRLTAAVDQLEEAIVLDPLSTPILSDLALVHAFRGHSEKAMQHCRRALELDPHFHRPFWFMGLILAWTGSFAAAEEALLKGLDLCPGRAFRSRLLGALGFVYGQWDKQDRADAISRELERLATTHYVPAFELAHVQIGCGNREGALSLLERAIEERGGYTIFLSTWLSFGTLAGDPRFESLLGQVGMIP